MKRRTFHRDDLSYGIVTVEENLNIRRQQIKRRSAHANVFVGVFVGVILVSVLILRQSPPSPFKNNVIPLNEKGLLPTTEGEEFGAIAIFDKSTQSTSLTTYSYGTTNVDEFKRLYRSYLVSKQQQPSSSYLSTQAREKDANGNLVTTYALCSGSGFIAGFRNQIMALTMLVLRANYDGHKQLLLDGLNHKDTYGTNKFEPFYFYFDVEHWNGYSYNGEKNHGRNLTNPERFPNWLPRMVFYDPSLHNQYDPSHSKYRTPISENAKRPYGWTKAVTKLAGSFLVYGKGNGKYRPEPIRETKQNKTATNKPRNPAEILMLQGALQPHPALQAVVDRSKDYLREQANREGTPSFSKTSATRSSFRYMTLHARVEPDMQKHVMCRDKKVLNLQEIVDMIASKWPETPPVDVVFLPINRQYLEKEGTLPDNFKNESESEKEINWIAVRNLQLLNRLTNHNDSKDGKSLGGLWNGTVPVVEFGSEALRGTVYEHRPSISGAILNYFLGLDAHIFIGTEVSSFSHDVLAARFFRGSNGSDTNANVQTIKGDALNSETRKQNLRKNNYKYLPGGLLKEWITDDMVAPPGFIC